MKTSEIHDDREFYQAVHEYTTKVWNWGAHVDDDYDNEPTPDELIGLLNERIEWVKEHKRSVDKYLRKRGGPNWVRVIDGSRADSAT